MNVPDLLKNTAVCGNHPDVTHDVQRKYYNHIRSYTNNFNGTNHTWNGYNNIRRAEADVYSDIWERTANVELEKRKRSNIYKRDQVLGISKIRT